MNELRKRKYERWFRAADVDGDGAISRQDVVMMGERYVQARGIPSDSPQARQMYDTTHGFWESVIAPADADKDERVTSAGVAQAFAATFTDRGRYPEELAPVADRFFDLADSDSDSDGDGAISLTEFTALDIDASGALSRAEYHQAASEFFYGDDPDSPAIHIFGRLT
ncbi:calcium-binding protein [Streptomyces sp. NPDC058471]|uniref:calcium-binding protein n=1 Tax=Streptomyces sp. NPDC058471 TaxID=3346516 RepID=UPI003662D3A7